MHTAKELHTFVKGRLPMDRERFEQQVNFIREIDKEKNIFRQTHLTGHGRNENDAEHAWHMAIMAYLLREYANREIDVAKTMMMILIHDIVEIDAGDTYAYDEEAKKTQEERERRAAERLFGMLPEDQGEELKALFREFEEGETAESRFAHAMDNFQPVILNDANEGSDWVEHGVHVGQVKKRNEITPTGSTAIWSYMEEILKKNLEKGSLLP